MAETLDVVIVGAGSAGLSALREVRKRTERFALVSEEPWGTTCARVGCMPSKLLLEAARASFSRTHLQEVGLVGAEKLSIDPARVLGRLRRLRDEFVASTLELTRDLGARAIRGRARLAPGPRVIVNGHELRARRIVLATGSRPIVPEAFQRFGDRVLTTDTVFLLETLPTRIAVVGLGSVGLELAQGFSRLGSEVVAFDSGHLLADLSDPEVSAVACKLLEREVTVHLGELAELGSERDGVRVTAGGATVVVERVVAALGRSPILPPGLEALGVRLDERGMPPFDPQTLQIADLPVFLAGDANGASTLHEAVDDGYIAGRNAVSEMPLRFARRTPLTITFFDPEIATIGRRHGDLDTESIVIGEARFERQGRARIVGRNAGIVRIFADRHYGLLLGAELCAPGGEHFAHLLALAIGRRLTVHDLLRQPFYHPTLEEGLRRALREIAKRLPPCHETDLAGCGPLEAEALD